MSDDLPSAPDPGYGLAPSPAALPLSDIMRTLSFLSQPGPDPVACEYAELRNEHVRLLNAKLRAEIMEAAPNLPTTLGALAEERADYVFVGGRGSGKSTTAAALAMAYRDRGWTFCRYLFGKDAIMDPERLPEKAVVLCDEAAKAFAFFRGKQMPADLAGAIAMARHDSRAFIFVGQHSHQLPPEVLRFDYRLAVKGRVSQRTIGEARSSLVEDLKAARRDMTFLPPGKSTTWFSLEDETKVWTQNGPGPWL